MRTSAIFLRVECKNDEWFLNILSCILYKIFNFILRYSYDCFFYTPRLIGGSDNKLIYRHYATLYFVFCVDSSESELGILDLIQVLYYQQFISLCLCCGSVVKKIVLFVSSQVFVETLDKCFENVCELDLIFHVDKVVYNDDDQASTLYGQKYLNTCLLRSGIDGWVG